MCFLLKRNFCYHTIALVDSPPVRLAFAVNLAMMSTFDSIRTRELRINSLSLVWPQSIFRQTNFYFLPKVAVDRSVVIKKAIESCNLNHQYKR